MKSFLNLLLVLAISAGCLGGAYYLGKDSPTKLLKWKWANGKIFGYTDRVAGTYKKLRVKFTHEEKQYEFTTMMSTKNYVHNESIGVVFPDGEPEKAEVRSYKQLLLFPALLLLAGLFMGVIGITTLYRMIRGKNVVTG